MRDTYYHITSITKGVRAGLSSPFFNSTEANFSCNLLAFSLRTFAENYLPSSILGSSVWWFPLLIQSLTRKTWKRTASHSHIPLKTIIVLALVCLTHDRGLKFRDVISALRYCLYVVHMHECRQRGRVVWGTELEIWRNQVPLGPLAGFVRDSPWVNSSSWRLYIANWSASCQLGFLTC